jgi:hypothetical protein
MAKVRSRKKVTEKPAPLSPLFTRDPLDAQPAPNPPAGDPVQ